MTKTLILIVNTALSLGFNIYIEEYTVKYNKNIRHIKRTYRPKTKFFLYILNKCLSNIKKKKTVQYLFELYNYDQF